LLSSILPPFGPATAFGPANAAEANKSDASVIDPIESRFFIDHLAMVMDFV
jgi:hypothetical protein